jgi:hypothetical protein
MNSLFKTISDSYRLKAFLLIAITAVLYGFLINNLNLWSDELYSVLMAKDSFSDMWLLLTTEDSKPPLYYFYLKAFLSIAPKEYEIWVAHFSSFILLILAQIFVATAVKKDFGASIALWLIFLIAVMPQSLWLAFEVRTYMLSSFLLLVCLVYGLRLTRTPCKIDFIKFGICSVLALYTHYYCAIYLMFLYLGILITQIRYKTFQTYGKNFIITSVAVALCFAPWLYVPLSTAGDISKIWYVHMGFVKASIGFFIDPLNPEIFQSEYVRGTLLEASVFTFIVIIGMFNIKKDSLLSRRVFIFSLATFILSYILLIILSIGIRPMVTSRYLKLFSLIWYMSGAVVLANCKNFQKAFILVALIGFVFTYLDIKAISFNMGYKNAVEQIYKNIPKRSTLLAFDNSNLFCEYYLPDYKCILQVGKGGEILRKHNVMRNINLYTQPVDNTMFSISIFGKPEAECIDVPSYYRFNQNVHICKFDKSEAKKHIIGSLIFLENN